MWSPTVDISENDNELTFKAELPGIELKDITVSLDNNVLTIKGERRFEKETDKENYHRVERMYGNFSRSFALPTFIDESKVNAMFKNGVLKIVLPKKEHAKTRGIEVKAA
jgi:HSP20 family protein